MILSKLIVSFLTLLACCNAGHGMHPFSNKLSLYEKRHADHGYIDDKLLSGFLRTGKPKELVKNL